LEWAVNRDGKTGHGGGLRAYRRLSYLQCHGAEFFGAHFANLIVRVYVGGRRQRVPSRTAANGGRQERPAPMNRAVEGIASEKVGRISPWRFCVAPMMQWTDRHCRFFHRLLTRRARLYTEMLTTGAVLRGDRERLLHHERAEQPLVLQMGGADPSALAACARVGAELGFAEINLNAGCPSDRVQDGRFGACLMEEPALVGDCVAAMKAAVTVPITVKCRIGIDEQDAEEALEAFALAVEQAGVDALVVHARKAWLKGLSPKQNREIPPLDYGRVYRLKAAHPHLPIVLNGGVAGVEDALEHLAHVDGVMMGRVSYQEPWRLLAVDPLVFGEPARFASPKQVTAALVPYIERELAQGTRLQAITRHLHGLFCAVPGARAFRRQLASAALNPDAGAELLIAALALVSEGVDGNNRELARTAA
jgi:tRNA-dihydrouridine synthase A